MSIENQGRANTSSPIEDTESSDQIILREIQEASPEAARLIEELKNPGLTSSEFLAKISQFNGGPSQPAPEIDRGSFGYLNFKVNQDRFFDVRIYEDGKITIGGFSK